MKTATCASFPVAAASCDAQSLCALFDTLFRETQDTVLCAGAEEPLYLPARGRTSARVYFREDFIASALHEVAHWCIAGAARRARTDYGYWYEPDGRSAQAQRRFVAVEARPQALEWCFAQACGESFRLSLDNLEAPPSASDRRMLAEAVVDAGWRLRREGLPARGALFLEGLAARFNPGFRLADLRFELAALL